MSHCPVALIAPHQVIARHAMRLGHHQEKTCDANLHCLVGFCGLMTFSAGAYGPDGHHTIGAIADRLIAGTNTESQVRQILGGLSLEDAAVWADCAKGVAPTTFKYGGDGKYPECGIFETDQGKAEMEDYVRRNAMQCHPGPKDEICHKGYR